jgi:hypothetical protein
MAKHSIHFSGLSELFAENSLSCAPTCLQMYDTTPLLRKEDEDFIDIRRDFFTLIFMFSFILYLL